MTLFSRSQKRPEHSWLAVTALAVAAFIFNTTEFVPVGLLPNIASSFDMSVSQTGLIMTVYAWAVTILSLPLTMLTARFERRKLLLCLFVLFVSSHVLAAMAWSFASLLVARLGIAAAHAVFWSITIPMAVRLAPNGKHAKALSFIITGSSLATVLGVPIGTVLGQYWGWRTTFGVIGVGALLIMLLLAFVLPLLPSHVSGNIKVLPSLLKRKALLYVYVALALVIGAHFTAYTYVSPFLEQVGHLSERQIVIMLFAMGLAGIIGGVIFARSSQAHPRNLLLWPMLVVTACLCSWHWLAHSAPLVWAQAILWGVALTILAMVLQNKVLQVASDAPDIAIAMFSGIYNLGIGAGALMGGLVIENMGLPYVGYVGSVLVVVGMLLYVGVGQKLWLQQHH